jgi:putative transposase
MQFPGAVYHVLDRGDRREAIFLADADREMFLHTLGEACERTGWRIHAYVLMSNHYHLLLETPEPNLVAGMRGSKGPIRCASTAGRQLRGHVFQGRYKSDKGDPVKWAILMDFDFVLKKAKEQ